jgi:MOSC domain-containing protein YiiM
MASGRVVAIYTTQEAGASMNACAEIAALEGVGLAGDRYASGAGTYSSRGGDGRAVTLVAREAIAAVNANGTALGDEETRRNLVTEGVALDDLIGREFRVGEVVLRGVRTCPPCAWLEGLTRPGVKDALEGRGGLRADVVRGGSIRVGDAVTAVEG